MITKKRIEQAASAAEMPQVEFAERTELRDWLLKNHASAKGIWVVTTKRAAGGSIAWNDIVLEALCFGWIDSLPRKLDASRTMLRLTPRNPKSKWSAKNKEHVANLQRTGLMHPAGAAVVQAARSSGAWDALNEVSLLIVPPDLSRALQANGSASAEWERFPPSTRRGILEWINSAKRPETRQARINQTAELAEQGIRANQWSPKTR